MCYEEQLYFELKTLVDDYLRGDVTAEEYEELRIQIMVDIEDLRDANF